MSMLAIRIRQNGEYKIVIVRNITYTYHYGFIHKHQTYLRQTLHQRDQIKVAKCLQNLPKNDFTRKIKDFDTFTKIA